MKNKVVHSMLCLSLSLSMAAVQPAAVLAASPEGDATKVESGAEPVGQDDAEEQGESIDENTESAAGEEDSIQPEDVAEEEQSGQTVSQEQAEDGESASLQDAEEAADGEESQSQAADEKNYDYVVPTTQVPETLKDGTYTVPFRLFHAEENKGMTEPYGNPEEANTSMGNATFSGRDSDNANHADVTVKDGKVYVTVRWELGIGCSRFNWYVDKAAWEEGKDPKGGRPEDSLNGVENADGATYQYANTTAYGQNVTAIKKMTFSVPSENPVIYVEMEAAGMPGQTMKAFLGFYWEQLQAVGETAKTPEEITVSGASSMEEGATQQLTAAVKPDNAEASVTWTSSNEQVAKVDENGTVTAVSAGTATITAASTVDGQVTGTFELTVTGKKGEETEPGENPEIKDELVKSFYTLKDYVYQMDPNTYYLRNSSYIDTAPMSIWQMKPQNQIYVDLKAWIIKKDAFIEDNGYKIPDDQRETFQSELETWNNKLADPEYFGKIYSFTANSTKIVRGRTYKVPMKVYDRQTTTVTTPLGTEEEISVPAGENTAFKKLGIEYATVTVSLNKYLEEVIDIKFDLNFIAANGDRYAFVMDDKKDSTNLLSVGTGLRTGTKIQSNASYEDFYVRYSEQPKGGTETEYPVIVSLDWEKAQDVTEETVEVDKSLLQTYVNSINNRLSERIPPASIAGAYPKSVSEELKSNGLLKEAQDVLDNKEATQADVAAVEEKIANFFNGKETMGLTQATFLGRASRKTASDYTAGSWKIYNDYVDCLKLLDKTKDFKACMGTPGGEFDTQGATWNQEQREAFNLKNVNGEPYSTDPADGDAMYKDMAGEMMINNRQAYYVEQLYSRYLELEDALVSVKDLNAAIAEAEKLSQDDYRPSTYQVLQEAIADAKTTAGKADATKEEVSAATETLKSAVDGLQKKADKTALNQAIADAEKIKSDDYTPVSYQALTLAVESAKKVADDAEVTDEEVKAAADSVKEAVKALVKKADKTALKDAIAEAKKLAAQKDAYTEASLNIYNAVIKNAETMLPRENVTQQQVDEMTAQLKAAKNDLKKISGEKLDVNKLEDGVYTVSVNLWHATQDQESMGNSALYHTATLTVKDGAYTLRISGHQTTQSGQTGELDALRIVPDGSQPKGDGSNYKEMTIQKDGSDYNIDIQLENVGELSDYYYAGIKVHTVLEDGSFGYPMGKNWINNRLRISWDTLALKESAEKYPAFSATDSETGVSVSAKEGALPKGTKLKVTKVTDKTRVDEIGKTLSTLASKNTAYQISLYVEKDGKEVTVEPQNGMELTVTLPVPDGYDSSKVTCYFIDENNYANALTGTLKDGTYTVTSSKIGTYAVAEKKGKDTTYTVKPGTSDKTTTTPKTTPKTTTTSKTGTTAKTGTARTSAAKTGDETNVAMNLMTMMGTLTAAAAAFVLRRKR